MLYIQKPVKSIKELRWLIFEYLRIDEDGFGQLDFEKLSELSELYPCHNLRILKRCWLI